MKRSKIFLLILIVIILITLTSCLAGGNNVSDNTVDDSNGQVEDNKTPQGENGNVNGDEDQNTNDNNQDGNSDNTNPDDNNNPEIIAEYTVTWKDYNGEVLETDINVKEGTMPTYDGKTPNRTATETVKYIFSGWTPEVGVVVSDITYVATYIEVSNEIDILGATPVLSEDKQTVLYGLYPQTHVSDNTLIEKLENLEPSSVNGWCFYEGDYYCNEVANVFKGESYTFDNGDAIVNGATYWFKCEPISWDILTNDGVTYYLVTTKLLDTQSFYNNYNNRNENGQLIYANNYEYSDIRSWLNGHFYNTAFVLNNVFVKETNLDNSAMTSDSLENKYSCGNTLDKVFLPTYQDYLNVNYGFEVNGGSISKSRECKTTDYARVRGAWYNKTNAQLQYNGSYWTRTSTSEFSYCAWNVNTGGFLSTYAVDGASHCVRPSIYIYFQ